MQRFDLRPTDPPRLPFDVPFDEAIAWALQRRAVLPAEFYGARLQAVRARSFTVSGLAALDQVQQVADSLTAATAQGQTLREWQQGLGPEAFALGRARRELIFRNAVQTNYGIGRTVQQRENAAARGYLMWDAINDGRTRPAHAAMDGHVAPIDAEIWKRWMPPAGHQCLLPGTRVRGDFRIGLKSSYAGPAVEVLTRSGARLSVTGNHPILTSSGWFPAKDIKVGDQLVRDSGVVDACALAVKHNDDAPPTAEDVFASLGCQALGVAHRAAFEFHGDAQLGKGEVHVAGADGMLVHGVKTNVSHGDEKRRFEAADDRRAHCARHSGSPALAGAIDSAMLAQDSLNVPLAGANGIGNNSRAEQLFAVVRGKHRAFKRIIARFSGAPRGAALAFDGAAVALHGGPLDPFCGAAPSHVGTVPGQQIAHGFSDDASFRRKSLFARARRILGEQLGHVVWRSLRSWPGPAAPNGQALLVRAALDSRIAQQTAEQAVADGGLFEALSHRFPGHVGADQVIGVRHFTFRGHVFDFETAQGWMFAEGLIVSNCRCTRIALTQAQAQARGLGVPAPPAEPDSGWEGDPTDGSADLARIVQARRDACAVGFAAKKVRARGLWCDEGPAKLLISRADENLVGGENAPMPPPLRRPWSQADGDVLIAARESAVKKHPRYAAAKAGGGMAAAWDLASDFMSAADQQALAEQVRQRPVVLPVHAIESEGVNQIPSAMAAWLARRYGLAWHTGVVQINRVAHTGSSGWHRLANQARFDGEVQAGATYLLVDDFVGQGGTLSNLRGYLLSRGATVAGMVALTGNPRSSKIALSSQTLEALRSKHGDELEAWWNNELGFDFARLTQSEAEYLLRVDADTIRDRMAEARQRRGS